MKQRPLLDKLAEALWERRERLRAGQHCLLPPSPPEIRHVKHRGLWPPRPAHPGLRVPGQAKFLGSKQSSQGLSITRVTSIESNPDDCICNLIAAGLFLEFGLKAWEEKSGAVFLSPPRKETTNQRLRLTEQGADR